METRFRRFENSFPYETIVDRDMFHVYKLTEDSPCGLFWKIENIINWKVLKRIKCYRAMSFFEMLVWRTKINYKTFKDHLFDADMLEHDSESGWLEVLRWSLCVDEPALRWGQREQKRKKKKNGWKKKFIFKLDWNHTARHGAAKELRNSEFLSGGVVPCLAVPCPAVSK